MLEVGNTVKIKKCKQQYRDRYRNEVGKIVQKFDNHIGVQLENRKNQNSSYGCYWFDEDEVELLYKNFSEREVLLMTGDYKIAKISFMDEKSIGICKQAYALYDEDIVENDVVVIKTGHHGFAVAKIEEISEKGKRLECGREIVCKIDMASYIERKEKQEKLIQLEAAMTTRVKELEKLSVYERLSEKDETMKKLFDEFKNLSENI